MLLNFNGELNQYKLLSQSVIPRPIAWIVTEDENTNIAPFSFFTPLSSNPPSMIVSIGHKSDGTPKDTLANLRKTKKCVICISDEEGLEKMHFCSKEFAHEISEAKEFDIELDRLVKDFPPLIKNVPIAFFCEYSQEVDLKGSKTIPVIVEIKQMYIDDKIFTSKEDLYFNYKPIARVGMNYSFLKDNILAPIIP